MNGQRIREVTAYYRAAYAEGQVEGRRAPTSERCEGMYAANAHARQILDEIDALIAAGQLEKAFRWLGFVQGVLWVTGVYTIDELRAHNRPPE